MVFGRQNSIGLNRHLITGPEVWQAMIQVMDHVTKSLSHIIQAVVTQSMSFREGIIITSVFGQCV